MSNSRSFDAVLYAKHLPAMAEFYQRVLGVSALDTQASHVVLPIGAGRLWLHAIPAEHAASIAIARPPIVREDAAMKLSFAVASLSAARTVAAAQGGHVGSAERAWEFEGAWHVDGWDPEGNVIQFRAPTAG